MWYLYCDLLLDTCTLERLAYCMNTKLSTLVQEDTNTNPVTHRPYNTQVQSDTYK